MRFALLNGHRAEALPKQMGHCPSCGAAMIAKCGTRVVWHWAHKGERCDGWWEPETAWHRVWKDRFPADWQEYVCEDETGERHIADVLTAHRLVVEFQHSRLPPEERVARESFYEKMVWVVDGTRLPADVTRFLGFKDYFHRTHLDGILMSNFPMAFPAGWALSKALVLFDFGAEHDLWCLLPGFLEGARRLVAPLPRDDFVRMAHEQEFIFESEGIMEVMAEHYRKEKEWRFGR